jgi:diguanylate cyclase
LTSAAQPAATPGWGERVHRLTRALEQGSKAWTLAQRKESLQRVLGANKRDDTSLAQRLDALLQRWEGGQADAPAEVDAPVAGAATVPAATAAEVQDNPLSQASRASAAANTNVDGDAAQAWALVQWLEAAWAAMLDGAEPRSHALRNELAQRLQALRQEPHSDKQAQALQTTLQQIVQHLGQRQALVHHLVGLTQELAHSLQELGETEAWPAAHGRAQAQALQLRFEGGVNARSVRAAGAWLHELRQRQRQLKAEREAAQAALQALVPQLIGELSQLDLDTGRYEQALQGHAQAIAEAKSLPGLAQQVQGLLSDTRAVQGLVGDARGRLQQESARATELQSRVQDLELELQRLAQEVSTDALTGVANRRGLQAQFAAESARAQREQQALAVGLIDIDNFKKLNDSLGHAAGDVALKNLAQRVREGLRPADHVARFGGEEFVVLLPATPVAEAQVVLTRLQRAMSAALFLHEGREVLVTFSAGVAQWLPGEALDAALERADAALYEAKRSGKNRTCIG